MRLSWSWLEFLLDQLVDINGVFYDLIFHSLDWFRKTWRSVVQEEPFHDIREDIV